MLSKHNRLSLKTDRFRIERDGKTFHSPLFTYLVTPREGSSLPIRFAILVSKKNTPLSINRHRLRRHLTEILRHHLDQLPSGLDVILIPKKGLQTTLPDQILSDLIQCLSSSRPPASAMLEALRAGTRGSIQIDSRSCRE